MGHLDNQIERLYDLVKQMMEEVKYNLTIALEDTSHEMIEDVRINHEEKRIEALSLTLLVKERLYSKDLRKVSGIFKLVSDVERLGDHCEDLLTIRKKSAFEKEDLLKKMEELAYTMCINSMHSYLNEDELEARNVIEKDNQLDFLFNCYLDQLRENVDKENGLKAIYAKYLERLGDHACNIAEWTIFVFTGIHQDESIF